MPMQLTVSRNRKTSKNYNSEGFGVSLTVELDQSLMSQPEELQRKIDCLYREADSALDKQSAGGQPKQNGNGQTKGNGNTMTAAQSRAINAIGKRLNIKPADECYHELGVDLVELTVRHPRHPFTRDAP